MPPPPYDVEPLLSHAGWLRALARRLVGDPGLAEDLTQEALVVALRRRPERPPAFLARTIRRLAWRRRRDDAARARREAAAARTEVRPDTTLLVEQAEVVRRLASAVLALPEPERGTVLLRWFEELPVREVARRTGAPVATVHDRLRRAHRRLREKLGAEVGGSWTRGLLAWFVPRRGIALVPSLLAVPLVMKAITVLALVALLPLLIALLVGDVDVPPPTGPAPEVAVQAPLSAPHRAAGGRSELRGAPPPTAPAPERETHVVDEPPDAIAAAASLRVLLLAPDGAPIADGAVRCWSSDGRTVLRAESDALGVVIFDGLAAGTWSVRGTPPEEPGRFERTGSLTPSYSARVTLAGDAEREVVLGGALRPAPVRGELRLGARPASGVVLWTQGGGEAGREMAGFTDLAGAFELELPHAGRWCVLAMTDEAGASLVTTVEVPPAGRRDLVLTVVETWIDVAVVGPAGAVEGAEVRAHRLDGAAYLPANLPLSARTDALGRARLLTAGPGLYVVTAGPRAPLSSAAAVVEVLPTAPIRVELELLRGVPMHIGAREAGEPVAGAAVHVFDGAGHLLLGGAPRATDADGRASLGNLAPGRYAAVAIAGSRASRPTPFDVPAAEGFEPILDLEPGAWLFVHAPTGAGIVGVRDLGGRELGGLATSSRGAPASTATLRADGSWRIGPLAPGDWSVWTRTAEGEERVQQLTMGPGEERRVEL